MDTVFDVEDIVIRKKGVLPKPDLAVTGWSLDHVKRTILSNDCIWISPVSVSTTIKQSILSPPL